MSRQNRVNPFGQLFATPARGTLMGNRGCLHDADGRIKTHSARPAWVTCLLEYHGRKREIMAPGQYTELFFLDEATALAAGHRPCGTCQKSRYNIFKTLWMQANPDAATNIQELDRHLQKDRLASAGKDALFRARLQQLPPGVSVLLETELKSPLLYWEGRLHPWTADGYLAPKRVDGNERVVVLTPRSIYRALEAGYSPNIHPSVHTPLDASKSSEQTTARQPVPAAMADSKPSRAPEPVQRVAKQQHPAPSSAQTLYKLSKTPRGGELFAYTAAIFEVTGMNRGTAFPLKKFLGNFSGHVKAGRIEKVSGGYRLTPEGMDYFADRFRPGNPQHVEKVDADAMIQGISKGGTGWVPI